MGYLYENSNPERFQQLCQSLLATEFRKLQCFPIGQPDGGRDGWDPETSTVLQVKFKRTDDEENADWLIATLEKELPKIRRCAERGAQDYIIATNARGTAHDKVGRIDKVQKWMEENLPIRGTCFWRDDIDRRLDDSTASLKLKYAELLSLEDGLDVVLGAVFGPRLERQRDAVRAFVARQYESDKTVKFKQVSLSNDLLDLFIDIPVRFPQEGLERLGGKGLGEGFRAFLSELTGSDSEPFYYGDYLGYEVFIGSESGRHGRLSLGAAELLLSGAAQNHLKLVVLEGGPGQGKSTLAQYVCQMHRARYLGMQHVLDRIPEAYRKTALRIPLKIDLRDYAAFLEGTSPFVSDSLPAERRTLEVFVAQLIGCNSGGIDFTAHDVLTLMKNAPVLLFLDGLDEVADILARERLVATIGEALARWGAFEVDLQVVVTSRPSVFGRAPSFEKYGFVTMSLCDIDLKQIEDYAGKWVLARGLDDSEDRAVKKILREKLELAHIRVLTRNPMQLTILLSLIHQVGHSLPNQRTELYDRYVDLFLSREADKSVRVRENRAVLLGFIQHLAWILQTEAESSKTAGSISAYDLQNMARDYLKAGGHAIEIADDLFGGGLERVFVLVERIEGLFEFEVQPLREFYCARHLYSTAPVGTYRDQMLRGDRAQRFEALAANPSWLNVCRFYAGSCERGEIGTLVLSLEEMIKTGELAVAFHARRVGLSLLQDWVLSNVKYPQDRLIRAIFDDDGTQLLISREGRIIDDLALDVECGRNSLRDLVFEQLVAWSIDVRAYSLCRVLRANGGAELADEFCQLLVGRTGVGRTFQLTLMFRAGASASLGSERVWQLITEDDPGRSQLLLRCSELLRSEPGLAVKIPHLVDGFTRGVLDGLVDFHGNYTSSLGVFADVLGLRPSAFLGLMSLGELPALDVEPSSAAASVQAFVDGLGTIRVDRGNDTFDQRRSSEFWSSVAELARVQFGDTWATMSIAIQVAGIPTPTALPDGSDRLFDPGVAICARARAARLRRGGTKWWLEQLKLASSSLERGFWAGVVLMWSSANNLYELASQTNAIVDALSDYEYAALRSTLESVAASRGARVDRKRLAVVDLKPFSDRTAVLVAVAMRAEHSRLFYSTKQESTEPLRTFLKNLRSLEELEQMPSWKDSPEEALQWSRALVHRQRGWRGSTYSVEGHLLEADLRGQSVEKVLEEPRAYPPGLVSRAVMEVEKRYRPKTLKSVSAEQDWAFE